MLEDIKIELQIDPVEPVIAELSVNGGVSIDISVNYPDATSLNLELNYPTPVNTELLIELNSSQDIDICFNAGQKGEPGSIARVFNEVPAGLKNGVNKIFTTQDNYSPASTSVFLNGLRQALNFSYTESGVKEITFDEAPYQTDDIIINYNI